MTYTEKPWGGEYLLEVNDNYAVKRLVMNPGCRCSRQFHRDKMETIYVLKGKLEVEINGEVETHEEGSTITILRDTIHRMSVPYGNYATEYLECSTPELEDVVRVDDDWGRS